MKIPLAQARVFWVPWWDVDHHMYGCPIQVSVHTPRWFLSVRLFSNFAQGGDHRGRTDFHDYERKAKWLLDDNTPERFARLYDRLPRPRYCVWCLHDEETCQMCGGHDGKLGRRRRPERYVRHGAFMWHLWHLHAKERTRCGIGLERWLKKKSRSGAR